VHESNTLPLLADNRLPADAAWLFSEYDFETMTPEHHEGVIIERILERGTWKQLRWLFATYGEDNVAERVRRHGFRLLSKRSFALWRLALGITAYVLGIVSPRTWIGSASPVVSLPLSVIGYDGLGRLTRTS
jgi:hypothetical protein